MSNITSSANYYGYRSPRESFELSSLPLKIEVGQRCLLRTYLMTGLFAKIRKSESADMIGQFFSFANIMIAISLSPSDWTTFIPFSSAICAMIKTSQGGD